MSLCVNRDQSPLLPFVPGLASGELEILARFAGTSTFASSTQTTTFLGPGPASGGGFGVAVPDWVLFSALALLLLAIVAAAALSVRRPLGVAYALDRAIAQLGSDNPYAAAVIQAYTELSRHARRFGFVEYPHETVKEFIGALQGAIPISPRDANVLIELFDHARYGDEAGLTRAQRERALGALRNLREAIHREVALRRKSMEALN